MICENNKPYPKVQIERKNKTYAKLLLDDYASDISEETAIHLYLYQSLILEDDYPELSKSLKEISKVEMRHLNILGRLITLLGLGPIYSSIEENDFLIPWTSTNVDYSKDINTILKIDIEKEIKAICNYENHIREIDDIHIRKLLNRIIEDEKIHLSIFYYYYQMLCI